MARRRTPLGAAVLVLLSGCGWARWGYPNTSSTLHEVWEVPVGALLLPVALPFDFVGTFLVTLGVGALNPVNWLMSAAEEPWVTPVLLAFPTTSSALTLINPDCNLHWGAKVPAGVLAYSSFDDEDEPEEDLPPEFLESQRQEGEEREARYEEAERRARADAAARAEKKRWTNYRFGEHDER